jgi:hypothetical protein
VRAVALTILLATLAVASLSAADPQGPPDSKLATTAGAFGARMAAVRAAIDRLRSDAMAINPVLDTLAETSDRTRAEGFATVVAILTERVRIEKQLLTDLAAAEKLYAAVGFARDAERQRLTTLNPVMEEELKGIGADLNQQVDTLAEVLGAERELPLFRHYAESRSQLFETLAAKLQAEADMPDLSDYFARWTALTRARLLADQHQLLNCAYYANAFRWLDARDSALAEVAATDAAGFATDLGKADVNAVNMASVLNAAFASAASATLDLPQLVPSAPSPPADAGPAEGFRISIVPDRGVGGIYYYSDSPEGLRDATIVETADGRQLFAERIGFTIRATRNCNFLMRYIDADGKALQLCPNRHAPHLNRLQANVPLTVPATDMPFEFAAAPPSGVEVVRLIVTPEPLAYNRHIDRTVLPLERLIEEEKAMRAGRDDLRKLRLQRPAQANRVTAPNTAFFADGVPGNAVVIEAFIQIRQREHE